MNIDHNKYDALNEFDIASTRYDVGYNIGYDEGYDNGVVDAL